MIVKIRGDPHCKFFFLFSRERGTRSEKRRKKTARPTIMKSQDHLWVALHYGNNIREISKNLSVVEAAAGSDKN